MPGKYKNGRTVGLWLHDDLVTRLDALAAKAGISRSKLMANIIELNVKSLERADSVGILSMAILIRDLEEGLKGWVRQAKEEAQGIKEDWENNVYAEETDDLAWNE